jgi:hypothetical protein
MELPSLRQDPCLRGELEWMRVIVHEVVGIARLDVLLPQMEEAKTFVDVSYTIFAGFYMTLHRFDVQAVDGIEYRTASIDFRPTTWTAMDDSGTMWLSIFI